MIGRWAIHGHAIVSADDRIAAAGGVMPPELHNPADWARFQAALDAAVVVVLGRRSHEAAPNPRRRNRLVLSSGAKAVQWRDGAWWWNPAEVAPADALAVAAPDGGVAAVVGGRAVFDYFLAAGYDKFHLARAETVRLPDGIPLFSHIVEDRPAAAVLADAGLVAARTEMLDQAAQVSLTIWRRHA